MSRKKKTVLVVTGTRAEYGLLRSIMDAMAQSKKLSLKVLVTGMHTLKKYGNTQQEIKKDGYPVAAVVPVGEWDEQYEALSKEIKGIGDYLSSHRPECVVVLGDRDEPFAAAIAAAHLNIPIVHIHGGDVTGPGVDEGIRHSLTKLAHLHFPATAQSARRLKALAEDPRRIFEVGSVAVDMISKKFLSKEKVAAKLGLDSELPWLVVLQHPTAFEEVPLARQIKSTLEALKKFSDYEKIILYPNSDTGSAIFVEQISRLRGPRYHVFKSLPREVFMSAVTHSEALVGNSSAGIIETAHLRTAVVNVGNRQEGRERAKSVIDAPYESGKIAQAICRALVIKKENDPHTFASPYGKGGAGKRIVHILERELSKKTLLQKKFVLK